MRQQIIQKLTEKQNLTGNHCGMYLAQFGIGINALKKELNKMYKDGLIEIRDGGQGKLIKLKSA